MCLHFLKSIFAPRGQLERKRGLAFELAELRAQEIRVVQRGLGARELDARVHLGKTIQRTAAEGTGGQVHQVHVAPMFSCGFSDRLEEAFQLSLVSLKGARPRVCLLFKSAMFS